MMLSQPSVLLSLCLSTIFFLSPTPSRAQQVVQSNVTSLTGTWSSGSGAVSTGPGFCNPLNYTFIYPANTGISWSFTDDGFFEQAEYQFQSNATTPSCIQGIVIFQHGTYTLESNGSIIAVPFPLDGRMQVQNPCAKVSNQIFQWNQTYLFSLWAIYQDQFRGPKLQLYEFDGTPAQPMYLLASPPIMLPTTSLSTNNTDTISTIAASRPSMELGVALGLTGIAVVLSMIGIFA